MRSLVEKLDDYLAKVLDGCRVQYYEWNDIGENDTITVVFQPSGSSMYTKDISTDFYFRLYFISSKRLQGQVASRVESVARFIRDNGVTDFGYLVVMSCEGQPVFTEGNRVVMNISLRLNDCA